MPEIRTPADFDKVKLTGPDKCSF